ncbi:hypothetical protein E0485_01610 [Paenibacillus albiflavus]|uniref:Uncharacterized protein n=1 Tax=Paenibacillus albiflavus TaxID=2545760 RepID=A0A4R4EL85_9BACL|nr:hypothetical protein [Paenibacillus albiflavus]TCZ81004.1 hypothetical protein E0485_01610 [Paenibacillus albiflavus]
MMAVSWTKQDKVAADQLQERLTTIKELAAPEYESYEIIKDSETGEHYLHYAYMHKDVAAGGTEEQFHYLMPLENDDVLGIMFSEQPYTYPDHWHNRFLRNGPIGSYIWFDPGEVIEELDPEIVEMMTKLQELKASKQTDEESIRKILGE